MASKTDVVPSIGLSSQVNVPTLDIECLCELLVEAHELLSNLQLIGDIGRPLREAYTDRLLNPHDISEIPPIIGVLHRF